MIHPVAERVVRWYNSHRRKIPGARPGIGPYAAEAIANIARVSHPQLSSLARFAIRDLYVRVLCTASGAQSPIAFALLFKRICCGDFHFNP